MNEELLKYQNRVIEILRRDYFPETENWSIIAQQVMKNNDTKLEGIVIMQPDKRVSPTFYVNRYYNDGFMPEATAQAICKEYMQQKGRNLNAMEVLVRNIKCYDKMQDKICYKLINTEMNKEFLKDVPHIRFNDDLSLCFYIQLDPEATVTINNQFINVWNLNEDNVLEELYIKANFNMMRLHPPVLDNMAHVLGYISDADDVAELEAFKGMEESNFPMYVLTNETKILGASTLAYNHGCILEDCRQAIEIRTGQHIKNLIVIPSSIHEVVIMPADDVEDVLELKETILDVNRTQVEPHEILSNNVFGYSKENGLVQLTFDNREICR